MDIFIKDIIKWTFLINIIEGSKIGFDLFIVIIINIMCKKGR